MSWASIEQMVGHLTSYNWARPHWRILCLHAVYPAERQWFIDLLDWFAAKFTWCTLKEGMQAVSNGKLDRPRLTLTFDDGDRTLYEVVLPILQERKIPACVYAVPDYINQGTTYRDDPSRPMVSWQQLQEWVSSGNEVGSHTYTHASVNRCCRERLEQEVRWSQSELEYRLGISVRHFAYPWGQVDGRCHESVKRAGCYDTIVTSSRGPMWAGHDLQNLRRDVVFKGEPPEAIETLMRLADRLYWLRFIRRRKTQLYWKQHPEERWEPLDVPKDAPWIAKITAHSAWEDSR